MCVCVLTGARQVRSPPRVPPPPIRITRFSRLRFALQGPGAQRARGGAARHVRAAARAQAPAAGTQPGVAHPRRRLLTAQLAHRAVSTVCVCVCVCVCVRLLPAQLGCRVCACVCGTVYVCVRAFFHLNWLTVLRVLHVLACMCALTLSRSPCCKYRVSACVRACVCVLPAQHSHRAVSTVRACVCVLYVCAFFQHRVRVCARQFD